MKFNWKKIDALLVFEVGLFCVYLTFCRLLSIVMFEYLPESPIVSGVFLTICLYLGWNLPKHAKFLLNHVMKP